MPKISIVMPTYNRSGMINQAIRSVIDQAYTNWELIIVDDGSTDNTERVVESFANPRISYKRIDHCGYVSQVRNIGNQMAKGDIVVVHDSDDIALPDRLEEIIKCFETNPDADVVYHGMYARFYDPYHNAIIHNIRPALPYDRQKLLTSQYIPGQIAYKRQRVLETPYDGRIKCCDDYQILLEMALKDYRFVPIYKNLYIYADSPDSINVHGEIDGSRKRDVEIILSILREKYGITAIAGLIKNTTDGNLISQEIIHG